MNPGSIHGKPEKLGKKSRITFRKLPDPCPGKILPGGLQRKKELVDQLQAFQRFLFLMLPEHFEQSCTIPFRDKIGKIRQISVLDVPHLGGG